MIPPAGFRSSGRVPAAVIRQPSVRRRHPPLQPIHLAKGVVGQSAASGSRGGDLTGSGDAVWLNFGATAVGRQALRNRLHSAGTVRATAQLRAAGTRPASQPKNRMQRARSEEAA